MIEDRRIALSLKLPVGNAHAERGGEPPEPPNAPKLPVRGEQSRTMDG